MAGPEGVGAVELFQNDDCGQFVLEGEGAEGPKPVGAAAKCFRVSVGSANEKSDPLDRPVLPLGPFLRQFSARWRLTLLIENDPEASGGSFEETGAFFLAAAGLERPPFDGSFHPTEVFGHPGFGESEFGFTDGEEEDFQRKPPSNFNH